MRFAPGGLLGSGGTKPANDSFRAFAARPYTGGTFGVATKTLEQQLLQQAQAQQKIQFNPQAALQARLLSDGLVPNSPEFDVRFADATYRTQPAEHLGTGKVRVYYCKVPDWSNLLCVERAGGQSDGSGAGGRGARKGLTDAAHVSSRAVSVCHHSLRSRSS
jgi:hypothetical protein